MSVCVCVCVCVCVESGLPPLGRWGRDLANPAAAHHDLWLPLDSSRCYTSTRGGQHTLLWGRDTCAHKHTHCVKMMINENLYVCVSPFISWCRLRGRAGETASSPPWCQDTSGRLHPWSALTSLIWLAAVSMLATYRNDLLDFLYNMIVFVFVCSPRWAPLPVPSRVEQHHSWTG